MANKRIPDNVHLLKGTYRPSRHGDLKRKPKVEKSFPPMPRWLDKTAKEEWQRIKELTKGIGLITQADQTILAMYCTLYSEFVRTGNDFPVGKHTQLRLCALEMGFTPSSRGKVSIEVSDEDEF